MGGGIMTEYEKKKTKEFFQSLHLGHENPKPAIGQTLRILKMQGEPSYTGRTGKFFFVDGSGQLHGSWGHLAIMPEVDKFEIV